MRKPRIAAGNGHVAAWPAFSSSAIPAQAPDMRVKTLLWTSSQAKPSDSCSPSLYLTATSLDIPSKVQLSQLVSGLLFLPKIQMHQKISTLSLRPRMSPYLIRLFHKITCKLICSLIHSFIVPRNPLNGIFPPLPITCFARMMYKLLNSLGGWVITL